MLHPPSRESKPKGTSYISCLPPPLPVGYTVLSLSIATHIVSVDTTGGQFHYQDNSIPVDSNNISCRFFIFSRTTSLEPSVDTQLPAIPNSSPRHEQNCVTIGN